MAESQRLLLEVSKAQGPQVLVWGLADNSQGLLGQQAGK